MAYSRKQAEDMAYSLGISMYFDHKTGKISQNGPGDLIIPPAGAKPTPHGVLIYGEPSK